MGDNEKKFVKEMLTFIDTKTRADLSSNKIGNDCYRAETDIDVSEYRNYTYEEIIQLYKIIRLSEIGVITEKEYNNLIELFYMQRLLGKKLSEQFAKEAKEFYGNTSEVFEEKPLISKESNAIIDKMRKIETEFEKYHLNVSDFELKTLIDLAIKSEDYSKCGIIELEVFTRSMKKDVEQS